MRTSSRFSKGSIIPCSEADLWGQSLGEGIIGAGIFMDDDSKLLLERSPKPARISTRGLSSWIRDARIVLIVRPERIFSVSISHGALGIPGRKK